MDVYKSNWIALVLVPTLATTRIIGKNGIDVSYEITAVVTNTF